MPSKNKTRGNNLEREVVKAFQRAGLEAQRAWGSDGRAMGQHQEVDVLVHNDLKLQCKRKKALPKYLGFTEHVDGVVFKEDRGKKYIMLELESFIDMYMIAKPKEIDLDEQA